jgi:tRNA-splicing ligase RtcB
VPELILRQLTPWKWEIPAGSLPGMRVPGIIFADEVLMRDIRGEDSARQVANGATLPGVARASFAMPDMHFGYGLPIGGVVGTDVAAGGVVSPGGTGYDINCGVRLALTRLTREDLGGWERRGALADALLSRIPCGVGSRGAISLAGGEFDELLVGGSRWAKKRGLATDTDLSRTEAGGCLAGADPGAVSTRARERGASQQGTLGSGNHFIEIQAVERVLDEKTAAAFGLFPGQVAVMIHSGSRGFGHQVCTDAIRTMERAMGRYGISLPDRQLACAPADSPEGRSYLGAMRCAANYAWANRQVMMHGVRELLMQHLHISPRDLGFTLLYDVAHNIVKMEEHEVEGRMRTLAVHRKGATRAFPPGHPEVPEPFRPHGQPVIIPGDMGRASWVLRGVATGMAESLGSACHGAGRVLSRQAARDRARGRSIVRELEGCGVCARGESAQGLAEEMPEAYKDVDRVVEVVHQAGLAAKVARLRPLVVIKG